MENFKDFWDDCHKKYLKSEIIYDNWLGKFLPKMNKKDIVLELGCGLGSNTKYLLEHGFNVLATDFSLVALKNVCEKLPNAKTQIVDITNNFPFNNNSFSLIIADLCLHYFSNKQTENIMKEIKRVLKPNGILLARVNSVEDINYGAGKGEKLEDNYYYIEGYNKRFYNTEDIDKFFGIIGNIKYAKGEMLRYSQPKNTIEIYCECKK